MRSFLSMAAVVALLLAAPGVSSAQSTGPEALVRESRELLSRGKRAESIVAAQRAVEAAEREFGDKDPRLGYSLRNLGTMLRQQSRHGEAQPVLERLLALREESLGAEHHEVADALSQLARVEFEQGKFSAAEPRYRRALAIRESTFGSDDSTLVEDLNALGLVYNRSAQWDRSQASFERAIAIVEKALPTNELLLAVLFSNLGATYAFRGRYAEAETYYRRGLEMRESVKGRDHPEIVQSLSLLAEVQRFQGRYAESENNARRALQILETALGPDAPGVAVIVDNLAQTLRDQGRAAEAELLFQRAIGLHEKSLGPDHPYTANAVNSLATLHFSRGRYDLAEPFFRRAATSYEKAFGPDHPNVGEALGNLAITCTFLGKHDEALPLHRRALVIRERQFGPDSVAHARGLTNLASASLATGILDEAEAQSSKAVRIYESKVGPSHPDLARAIGNRSEVLLRRGRAEEALADARRSTAIFRARGVIEASSAMSAREAASRLSEQRTRRAPLHRHVQAAYAVSQVPGSRRDGLEAEAFDAAQLAKASDTGLSVSKMASRFSAGSGELAELLRQREDLSRKLQAVDSDLLRSLAKPAAGRDPDAEARFRNQLDALQVQLADADQRLARLHPDFATLLGSAPLPLAEARDLLQEDEALLSYLVGDRETFLFVARRSRQALMRLDVDRKTLSALVGRLRRAMELPGSGGTLMDFPMPLATELFRRVLAPAMPELAGTSHLVVVADGPLQSLPLGMLLTESATGTDYAAAPWLARKYSISFLPSEASLKALRRTTKTSQAPLPFAGFGDPLFSGSVSSGGQRMADYFDVAGKGNVRSVANLAQLPESADEIITLARAMGADEKSIFLRERATERHARSLELARYRVIAFATHGLLAGELSPGAEPALALTPPAQATDEDDGLLTSSEIAAIRLDADWVILSACNTAAPDGTPGAEGLSGLAKSFLYAGSRSLLVSHWPVESIAAAELTTRALREYGQRPGMGKAEAVRQAMMGILDDEKDRLRSHPFFWAPWVVVGDGRGSSKPK